MIKKVLHPTEASEQTRLVNRLEQDGYFVCSIPNEGKRSFAMARKMKGMGMKAGIPDLLVLGPNGAPDGFFIEVKRIGGKLSPAQVMLHQRLKAIKWDVLTVFGYDDALQKLKHRGQRGVPQSAATKAVTPRLAK